MIGGVERRVQLPPTVGTPAAARAFIRSELQQHAVSDPPMETAVLLTSELVSNALLHARTQVDLLLVMAASALRVEVHDSSRRQPQLRAAAPPDATTGRGLLMVDALAERWGIDGTADGKTVWFELPVNA